MDHQESSDHTDLVSEDGKNMKSVLCQRCGSKVLCPAMAVFTEREGLWLPPTERKYACHECDCSWCECDSASHPMTAEDRSQLPMTLNREKRLFLPSMRKKSSLSTTEGSVDGDTLTAHWLVDDMYTFENVGFTKDVGRIKYLICADCEIGPIGWHSLDDKKKFYVALDRVNHA